jgi:hypothetical protein
MTRGSNADAATDETISPVTSGSPPSFPGRTVPGMAAPDRPGISETHVSVVFFVGDRAYKLKKPVRLDFVDLSTVERRGETPCSLAPISAPHIQYGRLTRTAWVSATCSIVIPVHRNRAPGACNSRGCQSRRCASFGSRSEFLTNRTRSASTTTTGSHTRSRVGREGSRHSTTRTASS